MDRYTVHPEALEALDKALQAQGYKITATHKAGRAFALDVEPMTKKGKVMHKVTVAFIVAGVAYAAFFAGAITESNLRAANDPRVLVCFDANNRPTKGDDFKECRRVSIHEVK